MLYTRPNYVLCITRLAVWLLSMFCLCTRPAVLYIIHNLAIHTSGRVTVVRVLSVHTAISRGVQQRSLAVHTATITFNSEHSQMSQSFNPNSQLLYVLLDARIEQPILSTRCNQQFFFSFSCRYLWSLNHANSKLLTGDVTFVLTANRSNDMWPWVLLTNWSNWRRHNASDTLVFTICFSLWNWLSKRFVVVLPKFTSRFLKKKWTHRCLLLYQFCVK